MRNVKSFLERANRALLSVFLAKKTAGFDPDFYRSYYKDLSPIDSPRVLRDHYRLHGVREGRYKSLAAARASLEAERGPLPADFDAEGYKHLNADIAGRFTKNWQLVLHYLEHGRNEGRAYKSPSAQAAQPPEADTAEFALFDADFYRAYYADLRHLETTEELRRHFATNGAREGRVANAQEAKREVAGRFGPLPDDFNPYVYRQLNPDLARSLDYSWQFELHFLEHGRYEGRAYTAAGLDEVSAEPWMALFRLADFVACAEHWLEETPTTLRRGLHLFVDGGIERLAPINLDYIFDPVFYRAANGLEGAGDDVWLYRHWLEIGVPQGFAPSEESALALLGLGHFPPAFDWQAYRAALPASAAKRLRVRIDALEHLFQTGYRRGVAGGIGGDASDQLFVALGDYHLLRGHSRVAISAYNHALSFNPANVSARRHRGDAHAALGNTAAAQADYAASVELGDSSVWPAVNAARAAAANNAFETAFAALSLARPNWERHAGYRAAVLDILDAYFAAKSQSAMSLYDSGDRSVADEYLLKTLDEIRGLIERFVRLPARLEPAANGHVAILANEDLVQCKHYRVEQKRRQLRFADIDAEIVNQNDSSRFIDRLVGARAAIFYRVPASPSIMLAIMTANALGIPTYYEIDDLIFDAAHYPDSFESYGDQISRQDYIGLLYGVPLFRYALTMCERGIASTSALAAQMKPLLKSRSCLVLHNGLDERNAKFIDASAGVHRERSTITIFYGSGTKAHNSDFNELAAPGLLFALERYEHVRLVIVGHLRLHPAFERFESQIVQVGFVEDLDAYWSLLSASDINLAVLAPSLMANCKSEIKWLEAAVASVPSIVSGTETYRDVLDDGVDALVVENTASAWTFALITLIEHRELRRRLGDAARRKALNNYSLEHAASILQSELGSAVPARAGAAETQDAAGHAVKVLICAVFFPPQNHGGATRVVADNVDFIIGNCPDIELSAFTTDKDASPAGRLRVDQYRGIPVFRLSIPSERNMDWRPFNAGHEQAFERVLDAVRPDVIHFHCIQRLTASIVEVALARKIPYLITVHDGWWISDNQFLVDQDDVLRLPSTDVFDAAPPRGVSLPESVMRRERLSRLLDSAAKVLSVSESFAAIYRAAGCRNVAVMSNGVSVLESAPRRTTHNGRLSLGHIGGRSAHKGAKLVEAVLRMNQFDHLQLTMIDFAMPPDLVSERVWGTTPVIVRGAYPQDQIARLYASLDVLLAPSIWPESFGLVAREARTQGLWVVASDRGAIAEGIIPYENGFVIDVSNGRDLTRVLHELAADVARFKSVPPAPREPPRVAADQGRELAELYRDFIVRAKTQIGADAR